MFDHIFAPIGSNVDEVIDMSKELLIARGL